MLSPRFKTHIVFSYFGLRGMFVICSMLTSCVITMGPSQLQYPGKNCVTYEVQAWGASIKILHWYSYHMYGVISCNTSIWRDLTDTWMWQTGCCATPSCGVRLNNFCVSFITGAYFAQNLLIVKFFNPR
jgi:hypothetical protein